MAVDAGMGVTLPPRIRAQVELLALDLGLNHLGRVSTEFETDHGKLVRTFIKIGAIKNQELEELAIALARLR